MIKALINDDITRFAANSLPRGGSFRVARRGSWLTIS
jgi:hypothetical protein